MRYKWYTKKQIRTRIEEVLVKWYSEARHDRVFSLMNLIGDYRYDSMLRYIKQTLFFHDEPASRNGAKWYLKYPDESSKKMAKRVVKTIHIDNTWYKNEKVYSKSGRIS